jgi:branched-chain amino acid transport system ATP-binding protein
MLLAIKDITVQFGGLVAVNQLNLSVEQGEILSLIGPNGAGKTTVLNCLSRYYTPKSGSILFDGEELLKYQPNQVIKKGIGRSFQNVELFSKMTVLENLLMGYNYRLHSNFFASIFSLPSFRKEEKEARDKVEEILDLFNLSGIKNENVTNLSFGIQKKIDMARAIISHPKLVLLDEPVAGTNPQETSELALLIKRLNKEKGITILMIEHDMTFVMSISDRVAVMEFGKKIAEGTPSEIQNNRAVIEAYLGEVGEEA